MPTDWKCEDQASGPAGNKTFRFRRYKLQEPTPTPHGPPCFHFNNHSINLKQNNANIDVTAQLKVRSHGYKTSATNPRGVAPRITYNVRFRDGSVESLRNLLTVPFERNTNNQQHMNSASIAGRNADDVVSVCWEFSTKYRIVKHNSR